MTDTPAPVRRRRRQSDKLVTADAAARAGMSAENWRSWRARKLPKGNPVPDPDGHHDKRTPWWWADTVDAWTGRRPSRAADTTTA